ncbi:LysR substrate-binding domain-containing protein [uncultured Shimia sp.]|uniref:LysR substrate-binding domain-containing protein n=1 Tax=uncultured Shimia sp. TaxID=573152 RepID=UPI00261DE8F7|nr:LysR substrate-binding domain-containing protein [uncultured Shimia sp.]
MDWSALPSLSALRAFEAAARHGSFSAAARELNVTHAAIAQHVRQLEKVLAEPLLHRSGRGVATTDAGRALAQDLSEGFAIIAEGVATLQRQKEIHPLNVSVTPSFATNWLMPRIGSFWQAHPDIRININPSTALVDLRRDGFDMAVRFGDGRWKGLDNQLLNRGEFWIVAAPGLLQERNLSGLPEAGALPWIMEPHTLELRRVVEDAGLDLGQVDMTVLETNELVLSATLAGLGVSVHHKSLVEREVANGTLIRICRLPVKDLGYYLISLPGAQSARQKAFSKWILSAARS